MVNKGRQNSEDQDRQIQALPALPAISKVDKGPAPRARTRGLDADGDLGEVELAGDVARVPPSAARVAPVTGGVAEGGVGVVGPVRAVAEGAAWLGLGLALG